MSRPRPDSHSLVSREFNCTSDDAITFSGGWDHSRRVFRIVARCDETKKTATYDLAKSEIMLHSGYAELELLSQGIIDTLTRDIYEMRREVAQ